MTRVPAEKSGRAGRRGAAVMVVRWAYLGLNQGPPACEAGALPLSYTPGKRPGMLAEGPAGRQSDPPAPGAGDGGRQDDSVRLAHLCSEPFLQCAEADFRLLGNAG